MCQIQSSPWQADSHYCKDIENVDIGISSVLNLLQGKYVTIKLSMLKSWWQCRLPSVLGQADGGCFVGAEFRHLEEYLTSFASEPQQYKCRLT